MKHLIPALAALFCLNACGLETATTAATAGAAKQQELEEGQQSMANAQKKVDAALAQSQQRLKDVDSQ